MTNSRPNIPYRNWMVQARQQLEQAGLDEVDLVLEWLVSERLGMSRLRLLAEGPNVWDEAWASRLDRDVARLRQGEPLAYVLGTAAFRSHLLEVNDAVLIPRPETEYLVDLILADRAAWSRPEPVVADVGTGSGCIAIALAEAKPEARVIAIDASASALAVASRNAERCGVGARINFVCADLLAGLGEGSAQVVVSNPPYVAEGEWRDLDPGVRDFEPSGALTAGADGLAIIRRLLPEVFRVLDTRGVFWLEMGETQASAAGEIARHAGFEGIDVRKDPFGKERYLRCCRYEPC